MGIMHEKEMHAGNLEGWKSPQSCTRAKNITIKMLNRMKKRNNDEMKKERSNDAISKWYAAASKPRLSHTTEGHSRSGPRANFARLVLKFAHGQISRG